MGSDILTVLYGAASGNARRYAALDGDEMTKMTRDHLGLPPGRPMALVSESGLYKLIMRSDKPEALLFQDWVTREVLPSIRKTGSYALADHGREAMPLPMDIAEALASFSVAQQETNRLLQAVA